MSLEAALQEHTQVMRELLARLSAGTIAPAAASGTDRAATKAEDLPVTKRKDEDKPAKDAAPTIDYEKQVRPLLVKVSTTSGRDKLVELLAQFNVTKGDQLKPAQYADVIAAANIALVAAEV